MKPHKKEHMLKELDFARRFDLMANSFDEMISGYSAFENAVDQYWKSQYEVFYAGRPLV